MPFTRINTPWHLIILRESPFWYARTWIQCYLISCSKAFCTIIKWKEAYAKWAQKQSLIRMCHLAGRNKFSKDDKESPNQSQNIQGNSSCNSSFVSRVMKLACRSKLAGASVQVILKKKTKYYVEWINK